MAVIKIQRLLYGEMIAEILGELHKSGFEPDKCIVIAVRGDDLKVASAMGKLEMIGALTLAIEAIAEGGVHG